MIFPALAVTAYLHALDRKYNICTNVMCNDVFPNMTEITVKFCSYMTELCTLLWKILLVIHSQLALGDQPCFSNCSFALVWNMLPSNVTTSTYLT